MNKNQKKLLLGIVFLFILSGIYVPEENSFTNNGVSMVMFQGFTFINNLNYAISIRTILIEWIIIGVLFFALYKYFEGE